MQIKYLLAIYIIKQLNNLHVSQKKLFKKLPQEIKVNLLYY